MLVTTLQCILAYAVSCFCLSNLLLHSCDLLATASVVEVRLAAENIETIE